MKISNATAKQEKTSTNYGRALGIDVLLCSLDRVLYSHMWNEYSHVLYYCCTRIKTNTLYTTPHPILYATAAQSVLHHKRNNS